jgi:hypothetical protein
MCQLVQALYELRQSAHLWNDKLDLELKKLGFESILEYPCIYRRGKNVFLIIHVDDSLIAAPTKAEIHEIKTDLKKVFGLKELGEPPRFLGCNLTRDREKRTITIAQAHCTKKSYTERACQHAIQHELP